MPGTESRPAGRPGRGGVEHRAGTREVHTPGSCLWKRLEGALPTSRFVGVGLTRPRGQRTCVTVAPGHGTSLGQHQGVRDSHSPVGNKEYEADRAVEKMQLGAYTSRATPGVHPWRYYTHTKMKST